MGANELSVQLLGVCHNASYPMIKRKIRVLKIA